MSVYYSKINKIYNSEGLKVLTFKLIKFIFFKFINILTFIILLPIIILIFFFVRILSNFITIRFFPLDFERIGNVYDLYWYHKIKSLNLEDENKKLIDLFFVSSEYKRLKKWRSISTNNIKLLSFGIIWKYYFYLNKYFWNNKKYEVKDYSYLCNYHSTLKRYDDFENLFKNTDIEKLFEKKINLLSFKTKDLKTGFNYLKKLGTDEFKYVCFASRDNNYLNFYNNKIDWTHHDWRNCKIDNYKLAVEYLSRNNIFCIRTGYKVEKKFLSEYKNVIDYADTKEQSALLDVYLPSKCLFGIFAQSGISLPSEFSGRPIVYVNWPDMHFNAFNNNSIVILKKYFSKKKKRYLKFKEILDLDYDNLAKNFEKIKIDQQIVLEENSAEEIKDAVIEQYKRLNNNWEETKEDKELQKKFWLIYEKKFIKSPSFKIGTQFLKKFANLL